MSYLKPAFPSSPPRERVTAAQWSSRFARESFPPASLETEAEILGPSFRLSAQAVRKDQWIKALLVALALAFALTWLVALFDRMLPPVSLLAALLVLTPALLCVLPFGAAYVRLSFECDGVVLVEPVSASRCWALRAIQAIELIDHAAGGSTLRIVADEDTLIELDGWSPDESRWLAQAWANVLNIPLRIVDHQKDRDMVYA